MLRRVWADPVWSTVIAASIVSIASLVATYFLGMWDAIGSFTTHMWKTIISSTPTPNWLLAIMVLALIALIISVVRHTIGNLVKENATLSYMSYTRDEFFGLLWCWQYVGNRINKVCSLCPKCHYQILAKEIGAYSIAPVWEYICDDCGYSPSNLAENPLELQHKVELKVQKNLRTGEWVNLVKA